MLCFCVALATGLCVAAAQEPIPIAEVLSRARGLMREGRASEAYAMLAPLESDLAGNVDYDYLLGIAALDGGKPARATLALERVLAVDPDFAGARLDMARAYFALANYDQAKTEFEEVIKLNPPPTARLVVAKYLEAIEKRRKTKYTTVRGYVETTVGYDNNVNNSTSVTEVYVPAFHLSMTLSPTNVQTGDSYGRLAAGAALNHKIKPKLSSYFGVDAQKRQHARENEFDTDGFDLRGGLSFGERDSAIRVGLKGGRFWLDDSTSRNTVGADVEWRHPINSRDQNVLFGLYNQIRYPDIKANNVDQLLCGFSWLRALDRPMKGSLLAGIYVGSENDTEGRADGAKLFSGLRVGGQADLNPKISVFAGLGVQLGNYDKRNAAFLCKRKDWQSDARAGLNWRPAKGWSVKPQLTYMKNDSNIVIYKYDRTDVSITIRCDFN